MIGGIDMGLFNKQKAGGFMDEIRCNEPSYLIWKWHPAGSQEGNNNRENAIRWGSPLRVKDGEVAVFVYRQADGTVQDFIEGPFDETIKTQNFPVLASVIGLAYNGGTPFQAEVYFINLAKIIQVKFGVPFFDVYDPRFADFGVPMAVRGTISFHITDYREFVKLHRLNSFSLDDFQKQIRDAITRYVKDVVTNAPAANDIPVVQIESKTAQITDAIEFDVIERLKDSFGVLVSGVDVGAIEIDKSSDGYRQLMSVTKEVTTATVQAQTDANIKNIHDKQRIEAENYQETLRVQREEGQYAQHKQTQSANFAAYQTEAQTQVGVAGAEALGKMGSNGAGGVDLGGVGVGFNPAAMMAGMAVGGAVGQNIAGVMNNMMSNTVAQATPGTVPPPIAPVAYHIAVNGQATGPFDVATLTQMSTAGTLTKDSLVWKQGMGKWEKAGDVQELQSVFANAMPPIPPIPEQ
jgi:membrane protease subunit (stomatin/prohibitin family)